MTTARDSHLARTIARQPDDLRKLLGSEGWEQAVAAADMVGIADRIFLVGTGTSLHAAMAGAWMLRAAGKDARAVNAFDFATYPGNLPLSHDDTVIVLAHTGSTTYSARAIERAVYEEARVLSIGSNAAVHTGSQLVLRTVEPEQSATYTSSHLCAMTALAQIATEVGERRGAAETAEFREALADLPDLVEGAVARQPEVEQAAREARGRACHAIAGGPNEATALEVEIKAREAARARFDGMAVEQFLHGPLLLVEPDDFVVAVNVPGAASERVGQVARLLAVVGARLWVVGEAVEELPEATTFALPTLPEMLSPLITVVPMQMLALELAVLNGTDPDAFRHDDPRYAAAYATLTL